MIPVTDGAVIYAGDIPFLYNEQKVIYIEFLGIPTACIFLAVSRDHEFLLSHIGNTSYVSHTPVESRKSTGNDTSNSHFGSTSHMQVSSLDPSDPWYPTYTARKRDTQAKYLALIKVALQKTFKYYFCRSNVNKEGTWSFDSWGKQRSELYWHQLQCQNWTYLFWVGQNYSTIRETLPRHFRRNIEMWSLEVWLGTRSWSVHTSR